MTARVEAGAHWCNSNFSGSGEGCTGFSMDPSNPVTLVFSLSNFTAAAVANQQWTTWWRGPPQPTPAPSPLPPPPPCRWDTDCNLNGVCDSGDCSCDPGWQGPTCGLLSLAAATPGQGTCDPSLNGTAVGYTTTWGGVPVQDAKTKQWHVYVAEMANHCGMCAWSSQSQIAHYKSTSGNVVGPYARVATAVGPFSHNPAVVAVPGNSSAYAYLMTHIGSGCSTGSCPYDRLPHCVNGTTPMKPAAAAGAVASTDPPGLNAGVYHLATSIDGPWVGPPPGATVPTCNNPHPMFLPDGRLMIVCHPQHCSLSFHTSNTANWLTGGWGPETCIGILDGSFQYDGQVWHPANEDPDLFTDARGNLHILTHNQSPCYSGQQAAFYGADVRGCGGHFFSNDTGATWRFEWHAVYNGTVEYTTGVKHQYKRERPKVVLDASHNIVALSTGIGVELVDAFQAGDDCACTLVVDVV